MNIVQLRSEPNADGGHKAVKLHRYIRSNRRLKFERMVFMMTIALVDNFPGKRFETVEDAVMVISEKRLELADIDIYEVDEDGCIITFLDTVSVSREENYLFYAYALLVECDFILEWYGNTETCYNTAQEVWDLLSSVPDGMYMIGRVTQTLHEYRHIDEIETVKVTHHHYNVI